MNEKLERFIDKYGLPVAALVVVTMFATGAISSPITTTDETLKAHVIATNSLDGEMKKLVRLMSVMCVKQADPVQCTLALTEKPAALAPIVVK